MQQLAETYAAEIGVLCVHRLGGRPSILKTSANPFALAKGLAPALVGAALDLENSGTSLSERFGTLGARAREQGLGEVTLTGDVGDVLWTADLYLSHAAPALLQTPGWSELWMTVNETAVRAAV